MPIMPPKLSLELNPPYNGQYYTEQDTISGTVTLQLKKSTAIRDIKVTLKGISETLTKMEGDQYAYPQQNFMIPVPDNKSVHILVENHQQLFPPENVSKVIDGNNKGTGFKIKPGSYQYSFQFKIPQVPKCLENHPDYLFAFTKDMSEVTMPPSFNNKFPVIDFSNLESYYYSLGKIRYYVKVELFLGKPKFWYTPFNNLVDEYTLFEYIPSGENVIALPNNRDISQEELDMNPRPLEGTTLGIAKTYQSTNKLECRGVTSWIEVRSKGLDKLHRMDYLFKPRCNKLNRIYLVATSLPDFPIRMTRVQLNLLEFVTYLAQGRSNINHSSLKLIELPLDKFLDCSKFYETPNGNFECRIDLKDVRQLTRLRFNEEDYRHRGNRLYSFTSCNIKRDFELQLHLEFEILGAAFQSEVITGVVNVHSEEQKTWELLPKYVEDNEPPSYGSSAVHLTTAE